MSIHQSESSPDRALRTWEIGSAIGLLGAVASVVALLTLAVHDPPAARATRALAFLGLSVPPLLLALPGWLPATRRRLHGRTSRWLFTAALLALLVPDRLVRGSAAELAGPGLYALAALLLTADRPRVPAAMWRDLALVTSLWIPLELGWISGDFVLLRLFGLDVLLLLYVVERPVCDPGRLVPVRAREFAWGAGAWLLLLVPAIPFSIATGFAMPGVSDRSPGEWALFLVLTFWVIALPEEALFRGVIQGLLDRALRSRWWALALASVVFGLSHLNNSNGPSPDWRYVVLATLAGGAYGLAYIKTRNLAAPTLTHFLVDVTWRGFFSGPGG